MELLKPLRSVVPELLDSPTLTRLGRIQRTVLTGLLLILPILHAVAQRYQHLSEFECTIKGALTFGVERKANDEDTALCHEEYLRQFPVAYLEMFLVFMWLHLLVLWFYSSYVADKLESWRTLLKAKEYKHKRSELKSLSRVFTAYISQLCIRFILSVVFVSFHVWSSAIFAPSVFICRLPTQRDKLFTTQANCTNGHASEIVIVNNTSLLFAVLCAVVTLHELRHVWRTSEISGRSDYFFCLLLLRENQVPGTIYLVERELSFEAQRSMILAASRHGVQTPFPGFPRPDFNYIPIEMFVRRGKAKRNSSRKFLQEEFRSHANTTLIKIEALEDIFKANIRPQDMTPKKILITGDGGIGKTTLVMEIARNWTGESGEVDFTFAFFFSCINMSVLKGDMTFKELLENSLFCRSLPERIINYIFKHPETVLLVFDGLDELDARAVGEATRRRNARGGDPHQLKLTFFEWFLEIAGGHILPEATVLTTIRTSESLTENLEHVLIPDRNIELHGFRRRQVRQYIHKFFVNETEMAEKVDKKIFQNCTLEALCYSPVYCFFVCLYLSSIRAERDEFDNTGPPMPCTATEVCEKVVDIFLQAQHVPDHCDNPGFVWRFPNEIEVAVNRLSTLAIQGVLEEKRIFSQGDMEAASLSEVQVQILEKAGFLWSVVSAPDSEKHFHFNHSVVQEFLAARRIAMKFSHSDILAFLGSNVQDRHYSVLQFVAGLCKQEDGEEGETVMARMIEEFLESRVQDGVSGLRDAMIDSSSLPYFCACLFEDQSTWISSKVAKSFQVHQVVFANIQVPMYNLLAVFHVLSRVQTVTKLSIQNCDVGDDGFRLLLPTICRSKSSLKSLTLGSVGLTDAGVLALLDCAASRRSFPLRVLNLRGNAISCDGARHLACLLFNDWCQLQEVYLGKNRIGHLGVTYLSESLCEPSCKVHTLDISSNGLSSRAIGSLSNALSMDTCIVKTLYLMQNKIGDAGFGLLCQALASEDCKLHVVLVSGNGITNRGVRFLRKPLSGTSCKLRELYLGFNEITDDGVKYLVALLSSYWSYLRVLSLARNPLSDKGVNMLAGALRFNTCNLERLHISIRRTTLDSRGSRLQVCYV